MEPHFWPSHEGSCVQVASSPQTTLPTASIDKPERMENEGPKAGLRDAPVDELQIM